MSLSLPPGYHFLPSKPDIFSFFLIPVVVNGAPIPPPFIDLDIYGKNKDPWNLFDKHSKEPFWVFTKLRKKGNSEINREAGSGYWSSWGITNTVVDKQDRVLGFHKIFTFTLENVQSANQDNGNWFMNEYSLNNEDFKDRVICEIKNTAYLDLEMKQNARMYRYLNPLWSNELMIPESSNRNDSDDRAHWGSDLSLYLKPNDNEETPNLSHNDDTCDIRNKDPEFSPNLQDSNQDATKTKTLNPKLNDETTAIPVAMNVPVTEIVCSGQNLTTGDSDEPSKQDCKKTEESNARHLRRRQESRISSDS